MESYIRIVCTQQEPFWADPRCARIISVGINWTGGSDFLEQVPVWKVVEMMGKGTVFYTYGETSKQVALVEKYWCAKCARFHIRSIADAVLDNNLDSLTSCSLKKAA